MTNGRAAGEELFLSLGRELREAREQAGRTQAQVSREMCYSRQAVSSAERGIPETSRAFWKSADDVLGTGGTLTEMYDQVCQATRDPGSALPRMDDNPQAYWATFGMRAVAGLLERNAQAMTDTANLLRLVYGPSFPMTAVADSRDSANGMPGGRSGAAVRESPGPGGPVESARSHPEGSEK
jgi:transcriptional regulator with XRE-family HTH domain